MLLFSLLIPALPATAASDEPWVFEGGGWGHGVGMSQFGVLGQVEDGRSVAEILAHYYKGTSLGAVGGGHWTNDPEGLWIGLEADTRPGDAAVHFGKVGAGQVTVCQPSADCSLVDQLVTAADEWHFDVRNHPNQANQRQCRVRRGSGPTGQVWPWGPCDAKVTQPTGTGTRLVVSGIQYAHGTLRVTPSAHGFHTSLALPLEKYMYGLAEVPSSWPAAALRVQAIAGRSYAVATAKERGGNDGSGKLSSCGCHLWATTVDQAYVGWSKEDPANEGNRWKDAVDATKARVVIHDGATIKAFYSSSNGGASENNEDVWGGTPQPWLRSVKDKWSADPSVNPLARWSVRVTDADMASYFGWQRAFDAFVVQGPPGVLVEFTGWDNGGPVSTTLNGTQIATLVKSIGFGYFAPGSPTSTEVRVSPYFKTVTDPPGFDDIVGNTFELDIEWLLAEDITKGCNPPDNTMFCPDDQVTRGQMAAFIKRFLDLPPASKDYFNDDTGSTFEADINRLAEAGITKGCNPPANTRFCPDDNVNRGEMAAFLVRALELTADTHEGFADVPPGNTFVADIGKLATAGITKGCNPPANDRYCPHSDVTRGQMAAFLHRADKHK